MQSACGGFHYLCLGQFSLKGLLILDPSGLPGVGCKYRRLGLRIAPGAVSLEPGP
mgnify:CR=1 FL=1